MRPPFGLHEYDWRIIQVIIVMVVANVALISIINSLAYHHSGEKHTQRYLEKHGYSNVEILKFSPNECECVENGGYEFKAVNINGVSVARKACYVGHGEFIIYELYGCGQPKER